MLLLPWQKGFPNLPGKRFFLGKICRETLPEITLHCLNFPPSTQIGMAGA
jgi:hypothetical protein